MPKIQLISLKMELRRMENAISTAFNIEELTWSQIRLEVKESNKCLFEAVEAIDPNKKFTLIKARYPYGGMIIDKGTLHLPHQSGASVSLFEPWIAEKLRKQLGYSAIPLALSLNKANEVFATVSERIIPLRLLLPGKLFGLFEATNLLSGLHIESAWSVTSGGRSIFMLPKIANKLGYQRLKKELGILINAPHSLADHWEIFRRMSNHPAHSHNWYNDVLFFTNSWFEKPYHDAKWAGFYNYLFRESTLQTRFTGDDAAFNLAWQHFAAAISSRNLRPRPYILHTLKHLIAVGAGMLPGFRPADTRELVAPIRLLQDLYTQVYGLKYYLPTILHSYNLMPGQKLYPLYYSLTFPFFPERLPAHKANLDILADTREVKLLFDILYAATKNANSDLIKANELIDHLQYNYFHNGTDMYNEIQSAKNIPASDPSMIEDEMFFKERDFCSTAPFLSGCIQITRKTHFALK